MARSAWFWHCAYQIGAVQVNVVERTASLAAIRTVIVCTCNDSLERLYVTLFVLRLGVNLTKFILVSAKYLVH